MRWVVAFFWVLFAIGCSEDPPSDSTADTVVDTEQDDIGDVGESDAISDVADEPDGTELDILNEDIAEDVAEDIQEPEDVVTAPVGAIVITEIMKNPEVVTDGEGEWVEVYNASDEPIDLQGWTLGDAKNDSHEIDTSLLIKPGETLVFASEGDPAINGGVDKVNV